MSREKQIDEILDIMYPYCKSCFGYDQATAIYDAGYRKVVEEGEMARECEKKIEELTDEVNEARAKLTQMEEENVKLMREKTALECIISTTRNRSRAETVREMHFEIQQRCIKGGIYPAFVGCTVDKVAYEMTGDTFYVRKFMLEDENV